MNDVPPRSSRPNRRTGSAMNDVPSPHLRRKIPVTTGSALLTAAAVLCGAILPAG